MPRCWREIAAYTRVPCHLKSTENRLSMRFEARFAELLSK